eukprot:3744188-Prymnesium_polylepis.1
MRTRSHQRARGREGGAGLGAKRARARARAGGEPGLAVAHLRARPSGALARAQHAVGRREVEVGAGLGLHGAVHV